MQTNYDSIVVNFVQKKKGHFILVSDDVLFEKTFLAMLKTLALTEDSLTLATLDTLILKVKENIEYGNFPLVILELFLKGNYNIEKIKELKNIFKNIKIICLTNEIDRDKIAHILEYGADNVIVKPVSINSLIQKIAFTVKSSGLSKLVDKCKGFIENNNLEEAESIVNKILKIKPDSSIAYILKGDIFKKRNKIKEAEECYLEASKRSKLYLEPLKKLVELHEAIGDLEKKLAYLKRLDKLSPLNYNRKIEIGKTYIDLDKVDEGKEYLDEAVKQIKKYSQEILASTLMDIALKIKDKVPHLSSKYIEEAINFKADLLNINDLWMFNELGILLRKQGKWEEAARYYQKALKIAPVDSHLHYNIALAYLEGNKPYKALDFAQKALDLDPELPLKGENIAYNLAYIFYRSHKVIEAQKMLSLCFQQNPRHAKAIELARKLRG